MAAVADVAEAILAVQGKISTFRLQKLVYYAQAVHLVRTGEPLFGERIEAWRKGPCVPALYRLHRGRFKVGSVEGDTSSLLHIELESIRSALDYYGDQTTNWLVNQTHLDDPWREARKGVPEHGRTRTEITIDAISSYYWPILADPDVENALNSLDPASSLTVDELEGKYGRYRQ